MKLVTYSRDGSVSWGVVIGEAIVDVPCAWSGSNPPRTVKAALERGAGCLGKVAELAGEGKESISLDSVKLLAPIPRPGKAIALAGNYAKHIEEASVKRGFKLGMSEAARTTTTPRPFIMPVTAVAGPGETVEWPVHSEQIDYEIELVVVIGKRAKCVEAGEALGYVAGYTIGNDVSARSVTFSKGREKRPWDEFFDWLNGKWADGFFPMGPYLVTADEVGDVQNLEMKLTVNDKVRQDANTSQMIYPVADIVSFVSHIMTLEVGDVIATGTPSGVGVATGVFLQAGDRIDCAIEKLGTLTNYLGERPKQFYEPLA